MRTETTHPSQGAPRTGGGDADEFGVTGDRDHVGFGDHRLFGLGLAFVTAWMWATMPIMLKILVTALDPVTLSCARFFTAGLLILPVVLFNRSYHPLLHLRGRTLAVLLLGALALAGNYVTFMAGLRFISPGTAQVVMQSTPMFVLVASLALFGERLSRGQWLGIAILVSGQLLFFSARREELTTFSSDYFAGVSLALVSALSWTGYMIAQKALGSHLSPATSLCFFYLVGGCLYLPFTDAPAVFTLDRGLLLLLIASGAATMVSYFIFAVSLRHAESSRVGVVIALMPVFTVTGMGLFTSLLPGILEPEQLEAATVTGGLLVVAGVMLGALGSRSTAG